MLVPDASTMKCFAAQTYFVEVLQTALLGMGERNLLASSPVQNSWVFLIFSWQERTNKMEKARTLIFHGPTSREISMLFTVEGACKISGFSRIVFPYQLLPRKSEKTKEAKALSRALQTVSSAPDLFILTNRFLSGPSLFHCFTGTQS